MSPHGCNGCKLSIDTTVYFDNGEGFSYIEEIFLFDNGAVLKFPSIISYSVYFEGRTISFFREN